MPLLAGLDLGTTSLKSVLYDSDSGRVLRAASRPTPVLHPQPTWSEHDPEAFWQAVCACLRETCQGQAVAALGIASMAEAGVAINQAGRALDPAIAWFDRRSEPQAAAVESAFNAINLFGMTGQRVSPSFGLTKLLWLRENRPQVFSSLDTWLPLPAYILYRLTGQKAVDFTIASRSLLFDQSKHTWSQPLLDFAGLQVEQLPRPLPGSILAGRVTAEAALVCGLPLGTPCAPGSHDHLCASFASGAYEIGKIVDSTGTAQAVVQVLPAFLPDPRLPDRGFACYSHVLPEQYVLKAGLKAAGSAIDWLARLLSGPGKAPDYPALEAAARAGMGRNSGPLWLPHLLESGTPHSDRFSHAALIGARMEHDAGDIFRALLESLAFWLRQNLEEMNGFASCIIPDETASISLIGGVTRLNLFSQLKAHILNQAVRVPELPEASAVGAALLGGLAAGVFSTPAQAVSSINYGIQTFDPDPVLVRHYDQVYHQAYLPLYPALREINHAL